MLERETERYRRPNDCSDDSRSSAAEERLDHEVRADPSEARGTEENEQELRREGDKRGKESASDAPRCITDDRDGEHHRTRRDLAEGYGT